MRSLIIYTSLVGWLCIFGITSGILEAIMMFVLFGEVPGSRAVLRPGDMLGLWMTAAVTAFVINQRNLVSSSQLSVRTKEIKPAVARIQKKVAEQHSKLRTFAYSRVSFLNR